MLAFNAARALVRMSEHCPEALARSPYIVADLVTTLRHRGHTVKLMRWNSRAVNGELDVLVDGVHVLLRGENIADNDGENVFFFGKESGANRFVRFNVAEKVAKCPTHFETFCLDTFEMKQFNVIEKISGDWVSLWPMHGVPYDKLPNVKTSEENTLCVLSEEKFADAIEFLLCAKTNGW